MPFHSGGGICDGCQKKLEQAHPQLVDWYNNLIKPKFLNSHISWAFRGPSDQQLAFEEGKSMCKWPKSPHNQTVAKDESLPFDPAVYGLNSKPEALALDLFEIIDGRALFSPKFYLDIHELNTAQGLPIKWGGIFKSLGDADHFQLMLDSA